MRAECICACHRLHRGDQRAAAHDGRFMEAFQHARAAVTMDLIGVDPEDALHAAAACPACINGHVAALTSRKCWERPLPDAPRVKPNDYAYDPTGDTE